MNAAFAYLYDETLADKRFERVIFETETELARLGIEGKIIRCGALCDPKSMLKDCLAKEIKNVVCVGSDTFFRQLVPLFALEGGETVAGFLPIGPSLIGPLLGIPSGAKAAEVLAARLIQTIDIGVINGVPFLLEAIAKKTQAAIEVSQSYRLRPSHQGSISLRNVFKEGDRVSNPQDGLLECVIRADVPTKGWFKKVEQSETRLFLEEAVLSAPAPFEVLVDGERMIGKEFFLSLHPKGLRIITGRLLV